MATWTKDAEVRSRLLRQKKMKMLAEARKKFSEMERNGTVGAPQSDPGAFVTGGHDHI